MGVMHVACCFLTDPCWNSFGCSVAELISVVLFFTRGRGLTFLGSSTFGWVRLPIHHTQRAAPSATTDQLAMMSSTHRMESVYSATECVSSPRDWTVSTQVAHADAGYSTSMHTFSLCLECCRLRLLRCARHRHLYRTPMATSSYAPWCDTLQTQKIGLMQC